MDDKDAKFLTGLVVYGLACYLLGLEQPDALSWFYLFTASMALVALRMIWRNR